MLIIPALALVLAFALLITAVLRPPARPAALLSVYLLCYANIVLVGEITNSVYRMNSPLLWLSLHGLLAVGAWIFWRRAGRPLLKGPWVDSDGRVLPAGWTRSLRRWPDLALLGIGVALVFLFNLLLVWLVPPNNNDSLATHVSRIGYWLQRGSFFPWPSQRIWQISYPVNMQLQMFWTALFLRSDRILEIVQWLGAAAAVVAVFGLARLLGASRSQALFAALVWATFPEIILEATTTQNDLVAGTLFAAMLYLLFLGMRRRDTGALFLSALSLAIGLGTKQTLFFLVPGLVLLLLLVLAYGGRRAIRPLLIWGVACLASFVLLSLYMFVINMKSFGNPMGPETAVDQQTGGQTSQSLVENLTFNTARLAYQFVDPTGLPDPLTGYGFKLKALVVGKALQVIHFPLEAPRAVAPGHLFVLRERYVLQEDAAWYGPLFAVLVIPLTIYHFLRGIKKRDALRIGIFLFCITFLVLDAAFRPGWDPFQGRYFIPVVTIATPLIAFLVRPGRLAVAARWLIVLLALTIALETFLLNTAKPVTGQNAIWGKSRLELITQQSFYMRAPARMVDTYVPADATLGLLTFGGFLEYPFFREDFSRRLVQIDPPDRIHDTQWLKEQGIEYVVVLAPAGTPAVNMPAELAPIANVEDWTLFTWVPKP